MQLVLAYVLVSKALDPDILFWDKFLCFLVINIAIGFNFTINMSYCFEFIIDISC